MLRLKLRSLQIPFLGFTFWVVAAIIPPTSAVEVSDEEFQKLSLDLSEPAGYFGTDNLVSNETSFLHVSQDLIQVAPRGQGLPGGGSQPELHLHRENQTLISIHSGFAAGQPAVPSSLQVIFPHG